MPFRSGRPSAVRGGLEGSGGPAAGARVHATVTTAAAATAIAGIAPLNPIRMSRAPPGIEGRNYTSDPRKLPGMPRPSLLLTTAMLGGVIASLASATTALQQAPTPQRWITAWGTSQQGLGGNAVTNSTVRMISRV